MRCPAPRPSRVDETLVCVRVALTRSQAKPMNLCRGRTIKCVWAPTTRLEPTPHKKRVRQRPTLPHPPECSTIGAVGLSYRVRKGNRAFPQRYDHRNNHTKTVPHHTHRVQGSDTIHNTTPPPTPPTKRALPAATRGAVNQPPSGREHTSKHTNQQPVLYAYFDKVIDQLVPVSSTRYRASTSGLSTQSSLGGLTHPKVHGYLISKQASRLDAFSGYPFPT